MAQQLDQANDIDGATLIEIFRRSMRVYKTDERFRQMLMSGKLRLVYYPVRGQEVLSASMMSARAPRAWKLVASRSPK